MKERRNEGTTKTHRANLRHRADPCTDTCRGPGHSMRKVFLFGMKMARPTLWVACLGPRLGPLWAQVANSK